MGQFHFHPDEYLELMRSELPDYERLHEELVAATRPVAARRILERVQLHTAHLEDALPAGRFDLVVSALALHHLDGPGKADVFARVADALAPVGRFVLADVIEPDDPADAVTPLTPGFDRPSPLADQLAWLEAAGLSAEVTWHRRDLAVLFASVRPARRARRRPIVAGRSPARR